MITGEKKSEGISPRAYQVSLAVCVIVIVVLGGMFYSTYQTQPNQTDALQSQVNSLTAERNALIAERNSLTTERNSLTTERNSLTTEKNSLTTERNALIAERNSLTTEKTSLTAERNVLIAERNSLQSQITDLKNQINSLTTKVNDLQSKYNELNDIVTLKKSTVLDKDKALTIPARGYQTLSYSTAYAGYIRIEFAASGSAYFWVGSELAGGWYSTYTSYGTTTTGRLTVPVFPGTTNLQIRNADMLTSVTVTLTATYIY